MVTVVRIVEITVAHHLTRARRVNEFSVACINAYVIDAPLRAAKEHEVTWLEARACDALGRATLLCRGSRHFHAHALEAVEHEAAAIEAALRTFATVAIRSANEACSDADDLRATG